MRCFRTAVRKKDITIKPAKKSFLQTETNVFYFVYKLSGIQACGLISGVRMYAYADEHTPKRKMIPAAYFQILQAVIIQPPGVDALTCSTLAVYLPIRFGIPWDAGMETQVRMVFHVYRAPVRAWGTCRFICAGTDTPASEGAAVFVCILYGIIPPWAHFMPGRVYGMAGFIEGDAGRHGKDLLECSFRIVSGRLTVQDIIYDVPGGNRAGVFRLRQFSIGANQLFGVFAVFACGKKSRAGIAVPWVCPESVHKVIIRAEGRQFFQRGAANKDSQGNGFGKDFPHP